MASDRDPADAGDTGVGDVGYRADQRGVPPARTVVSSSSVDTPAAGRPDCPNCHTAIGDHDGPGALRCLYRVADLLVDSHIVGPRDVVASPAWRSPEPRSLTPATPAGRRVKGSALAASNSLVPAFVDGFDDHPGGGRWSMTMHGRGRMPDDVILAIRGGGVWVTFAERHGARIIDTRTAIAPPAIGEGRR